MKIVAENKDYKIKCSIEGESKGCVSLSNIGWQNVIHDALRKNGFNACEINIIHEGADIGQD